MIKKYNIFNHNQDNWISQSNGLYQQFVLNNEKKLFLESIFIDWQKAYVKYCIAIFIYSEDIIIKEV